MIRFFIEDISVFNINKKLLLKKCINDIIYAHHFKPGDINYIFCSDQYLLQINRQYLKHDYYTDIITFNNSHNNKIVDADIFISIERILDNADFLKESVNNEIFRVIIHGILHLIGYNDKNKEERKLMREKENFYIDTFNEGLKAIFTLK